MASHHFAVARLGLKPTGPVFFGEIVAFFLTRSVGLRFDGCSAIETYQILAWPAPNPHELTFHGRLFGDFVIKLFKQRLYEALVTLFGALSRVGGAPGITAEADRVGTSLR
ncbi:hypothetical protein D3C79_697630 [compost metagenome]